MNELLINSTKLLSANSSIQREYLRKSGLFPCTDEIALSFDDVYRYHESKKDDPLIGSLSEKLKQINTILDALSNSEDKEVWDEKSLDNQSWTEIRNIAITILEEINGLNIE
jgi:hypothetical protein